MSGQLPNKICPIFFGCLTEIISRKRTIFLHVEFYANKQRGRFSQAIVLQPYRSSHHEMFLEKDVLKICSKFTGEHPCRSVISIKLLCNFIEIALRHGCSPVNLLHIFRTPFPKNTSGGLLLQPYKLKCLILSKISNSAHTE